jgi:hypothetical protein
MNERGAACGMDKRKVCVFLMLVGIGILCLLVMVYTLFFARPRTNPAIQSGQHSSLPLDPSSFVRS